jgi:CRP-like cAMP-binding protein
MLNDAQIALAGDCPLFGGIPQAELALFLRSAQAASKRLETGEAVIVQGQSHRSICVLLSGAARGEKLTADGRLVIVNEFSPGQSFGDILSGAQETSPVTVKMTASGEIISLPFGSLLSADRPQGARETVLRNLISGYAQRYFALQRRLHLLLSPTLRGKIANYLLSEQKCSGICFTVPHSREEQAQLLGCDRSALSRELSRMKSQGLIAFAGRSFERLDESALKAAAN